MAANVETEDDDPKRLDVELFIVHPTMDPVDITAALGLEPSHVHRVGDDRKTPKGTPLPGQYRDTRWRYGIRHDIRGQHFRHQVAALLDQLGSRKSFLAELRATGGEAMLIVQFLGDGYFGDVLPLSLMSRLIDLQLDLGLEVYTVPQSP
ncbi:DUF4279 domain-containing protein [Inquilinus limosus]|uniref:DUF4279 domain-containing protein n=1 Tax=Inquilinus limosus TaxID=171674 RepID=UPI003F18428C